MRERCRTIDDERTVERFILFPKVLPIGRFDGVLEKRWWERCKIRQYWGPLSGHWIDAYWI
jgi:hypothetical protein